MLKAFQKFGIVKHFKSLVLCFSLVLYWYSVQCKWSAAWCFLDRDCHWRWTKHIF